MAFAYYKVIPVPLDAAGSRDFAYLGDFLLFQDARRSDGSQELDAAINVKIGRDGVDYARWRLNNKLRGRFDSFTLQWEAQAGVTAYIYVAAGDGATLLDLDSQPPKQIITTALGSQISTAAVTVTTSVTLLAAADSTRQSAIIQNNGSGDIYVGGIGVTTSSGVKVEAGTSITLDKTTAAIYAIAASGNQNTRILTEAS